MTLTKQQIEDNLNKREQLINQITLYCNNSNNYSVLRRSTDILTMWCGMKEFKIKIVDEGSVNLPAPGIELTASSIDEVKTFLRRKHNEYIKEVEKKGTERQKKALGLI